MTKKSQASVFLSPQAWKTILLDAHQRQHIEACGALLGYIDKEENWHVEEVIPLRNIFASPVYFEFDPLELLTIDQEHPDRMIGVYHSHPGGPAAASDTDRQNMRRVNLEQQIPWIWVIISGPFVYNAAATEASTGSGITAGGVVAYHHFAHAGLRHVAIRINEKEASEPA